MQQSSCAGLVSMAKYIFAVPFLVFGVLHLMSGSQMAGSVPAWIPGGVFWVYVTGVAQIAFALAVFTGKRALQASNWLAIMLAIFVITIHLPATLSGKPMAIMFLLKDLGLFAGALLLAGQYSGAQQK